MMRQVRFLPLWLVVSAVASTAGAQGSASLQGFGYPPGQLSSRAQGMAGSVAEIDGLSPLNPAALAVRATGLVYAQYDPELRTVKTGSGSSSTTTARFPNVGAIFPFQRHWVLGVSASTLLDRSWQTQSTQLQTIGSDTVTSTQVLQSSGGITDVRLALAYAFNSRIRIGVGGHGYTGSNQVSLLDQFADTLRFRNIAQTTSLNYSGSAMSAGLEVDVLPSLSVAVSGRAGGTLKMYTGDTLLTQGHIPDHYAAGVSFQGIPGTLVAARVARDRWSSLAPLSTNGARPVDADDISAGIESAGPRITSSPVLVRLGVRRRTLPFQVGTSSVRETSFGGGLGIPIAQNRAVIDLALLRSARSGVTGLSETAYNFSLGLQVHP